MQAQREDIQGTEKERIQGAEKERIQGAEKEGIQGPEKEGIQGPEKEGIQGPERVGILGGIFDPATISHLQMAMEAINQDYLDRVILVPCGEREDKQIDTSGHHRVAMLNICVKEFLMDSQHQISVDPIQIEQPDLFPTTYTLMKHYQQTMPNTKLVFIIGEILLDRLIDWTDYQPLNKYFSFLIYSFSGMSLSTHRMPRDYQIIHTTFVASESFHIKTRIKQVLSQQNIHNQCILPGPQPTMNSLGILPDNTKQIPKVSDTLSEQYQQVDYLPLHQKYLGIYGITTLGVIHYIIKHALYQ